jgi:epoxyqueuosine reductase
MAEHEIESAIRELLSSGEVRATGIAPVNRIASVPDDFSAEAVLEGAKSVLCYSVPIPMGILSANRNALALHWRYCNMAYRFLDTLSNRLCLLLEDKGHRSVPINSCFPWKIVGGEFWGIMPLIYWAQEAGLGKLTRSGLLAHPRYGTRILLGGVITTLGLEPSGKSESQGCPTACRKCVDACPVGAIGETGKIHHQQCIRASGANPLLSHLLRDGATKDKFDFETIVNTVSVDDHGAYTCFKCLEVCPLNEVSEKTK